MVSSLGPQACDWGGAVLLFCIEVNSVAPVRQSAPLADSMCSRQLIGVLPSKQIPLRVNNTPGIVVIMML